MDLNSILIGSEDPQRLADYYTKLFGEPMWSDGGYTVWQLGGGSFTVGPHSQVTAATRSRAASSGTSRHGRAGRLRPAREGAGAIVVREPYGFEGTEASSPRWPIPTTTTSS